MITEFNKGNLKDLRQEIDAALAEVGKRHGLVLSIGGIRFTDKEFTTRLVVTTKDSPNAAQVGETTQEAKWRKGLASFPASMAGIKPEHAGKTFVLYGERYRLVGFRPKAKAQVVAQKPGNKTFVALPVETVVKALTA